MKKVGLFGATGYTGISLVNLLLNHPDVSIQCVTSETHAGKGLWEVYPHLYGRTALKCIAASDAPVESVDLVFLAFPHGEAMKWIPKLFGRVKKIIDLSADYRLEVAGIYEKWYGIPHQDKKHLESAVYGLPELYKKAIQKASLVANPGCYATTAILALAPFLANKCIDPASIIVDAKSGVSGAGRSLSLSTHFSEINESVSAYKIGEHRHTPEIEQHLAKMAGTSVTLTFTPHLIPMTRGIFCTSYANLTSDLSQNELEKIASDFYAKAPFVRVLPSPHLPQTKQTLGSNHCVIAVRTEPRTKRIILLSVLDNLVKGAGGAAIQNMNLMLGMPEESGLTSLPLYP